MLDDPERIRRELEWLRREVEASRGLDDAARVAILEDLWQTNEAIRATKSPEQLRREDEAQWLLDAQGLERYAALAKRLSPASDPPLYSEGPPVREP